MKRFFIGILVLFCIIGCNGSGGSSGVINDKQQATNTDNTDNNSDTTDDGSVSGLKFKFSNPQRVLVVKRNVSTISQDLSGEESEVEVIQVNDEGGVSDVAKLDVKDVKKGDDGYLYMTLNTSSEGSYIVKANAKTNEYQYIDRYPVPSSEKGHNQNLQWSDDGMLYFKAEDKENSKIIIRKFDGTETKTVAESSKINDWLVCPDSSVYFTDDESIYKSDSINGVVKVGGGKKIGWIQKYDQTKEVRACIQDDDGYAIVKVSDEGITERQSLDGNLEEEQLRMMNPDMFVEVNDVKLLFTSYGGFGQMFQVYPYKDGNNLEVVVESLVSFEGVLYISGKSNDGGQVFWEVFISQENNWYRGLRPGYSGFEEQQLRFNAATTNDDSVYYTSIDEETSNVIIGEYDVTTGTSIGGVIDATEVISDIAM